MNNWNSHGFDRKPARPGYPLRGQLGPFSPNKTNDSLCSLWGGPGQGGGNGAGPKMVLPQKTAGFRPRARLRLVSGPSPPPAPRPANWPGGPGYPASQPRGATDNFSGNRKDLFLACWGAQKTGQAASQLARHPAYYKTPPKRPAHSVRPGRPKKAPLRPPPAVSGGQRPRSLCKKKKTTRGIDLFSGGVVGRQHFRAGGIPFRSSSGGVSFVGPILVTR